MHPVTQPRSTIISVRMSDVELARVQRLAKIYNLSISEVMMLAFRLYLNRES